MMFAGEKRSNEELTPSEERVLAYLTGEKRSILQ